MVSGFVLVFVFILTLAFGVIRIIKTPFNFAVKNTKNPTHINKLDELGNVITVTVENQIQNSSDTYAVIEDITKLIVELIFILFAILLVRLANQKEL